MQIPVAHGALVGAILLALSACDGGAADSAADLAAAECIVLLHGKGEGGAPTRLDGEIAVISPTGNGSAWGGREWRYGTDEELEAATSIVTVDVDTHGCEGVVLHGFSNGASYAAAVFCAGETFDGRLVGVVVDDPVTDAAVAGCVPARGIRSALYWTGALDAEAPPGTDCGPIDWTCAGGVVRGIDTYAADLGVDPTASPFDEHRWYLDAPEPRAWLDAAAGR